MCYRRADKELARGIERRLVKEFGEGAVFLDVEHVGGGREWKKRVLDALAGDPIVVTLITTRWNSRRAGKPRLLDPADHVRFELETALDRGLSIVPVRYESAFAPKEAQLPSSLYPLLGFQTLPFSVERWAYDADQLVSALNDLHREAAGAEAEQPAALNPLLQNTGRAPPPFFSRSMFQESPAQRKARADAVRKEEERLARARADATPFYGRPAFWIAAVTTIALSAASVVGAESLARSIGSGWQLPASPVAAGVVLAIVWAAAWVALGAAAYSHDPELGAGVFYTRGIVGGYTLGYTDVEPVGFWAAFPVPTAVLWLASRAVAWLPYHYLRWSYDALFWIGLAAYTLPVLALYAISTADEVFG